MKVISTNDFNNFKLNVYGSNDQPLFKANEVADILDIKNIRSNLITIPNDFKVVEKTDTLGGSQMSTFIKEPALYMLVFRSHKKEAIEFTKWVSETVLPTIRKTGKYEIRKYDKKDHTLTIKNEFDLHTSVVSYIREYNEKNKKKVLFTASLGELQDTSDKRINSYRMGYTSGQPDLLILNKTHKYEGYAIEFKSPLSGGRLSEKQDLKLTEYEDNKYKILISNDLCEIIRKLTKYIMKIRLPCKYCKNRFKSNGSLKRHIKYFHRIINI
jgi:prophage antirepressor-like protein